MNILKRGYDQYNSMCNPTETTLTPTAVEEKGIRRIFSLPFEGDARGCDAQTLYVAGLTFPDGRIHNCVFHCTLTNQIWCHDADTSQQLWMRLYGNSIKSTQQLDSYQIYDHIGAMSTPVIDAEKQVLYFVSWSSDDALATDGVFRIHAVDLSTGDEKQEPLSLEGASYTAGGATVTFEGVVRKQRASLLMTDVDGVKTVFIGAGSLFESASSNKGWLIAVDLASWTISTAWASTTSGSGAGIWSSGASPCADNDGSIYLNCGNGDFDGVSSFGESVMKLRYTPPTDDEDATLLPIDWWTPWTDKQRTGQLAEEHDEFASGQWQGGLAVATRPRSLPSNARPLHRALRAGTLVQGMASEDWSDQDVASSGVSLIPELDLCLTSCKDGILYAVKMSDMGKTAIDQPGTAANYAKLAFSPIWFTNYSPNDPAPVGEVAIQKNLNALVNDKTRHLHGEMVCWKSAVHGWMVFCGGENSNIRAWSVTETSITYLAMSAEIASPNCQDTPGGGMPGSMLSMCSNGENDGIIVALIPYGDANTSVVEGRMVLYDAQTFSMFPDGTKQLRVLWDSQAENDPFVYSKFNRPVVANGRIYRPCYDGKTDVYALV